MYVDARRSRWEEAENEGRKARLEDEPLRSNPYQSAGLTLEATLHVCWQRAVAPDREAFYPGRVPPESYCLS
jgi:hypothetical protein